MATILIRDAATFPLKKKGNSLQSTGPNVHSCCIYLAAVRGRLMAQKNKSEMARLITKKVVACCLSFLSLVRAITVRRLPAQPIMDKIIAAVAAKTVMDWGNSMIRGLLVVNGETVLAIKLLSTSITTRSKLAFSELSFLVS